MTITNKDFIIRHATYEDLDAIAELELACFPVAEAASKEDFDKRLKVYANHFLLVIHKEQKQIISIVDGLVTNQLDLIDEMYEDASYHNELGKWQMIFGVETHPLYQHQGVATLALQSFIDEARHEGRSGLVLTCKSELTNFYSKFGFVNEGVSVSSHGGVTWYQMRLTF